MANNFGFYLSMKEVVDEICTEKHLFDNDNRKDCRMCKYLNGCEDAPGLIRIAGEQRVYCKKWDDAREC